MKKYNLFFFKIFICIFLVHYPVNAENINNHSSKYLLPNYQQITTDEYIKNFNPSEYTRSGSDYFNEFYSLKRLGKKLEDIDRTYDYPFELVEIIEKKLQNVDRKKALKAIFEKITIVANNDTERHLLVAHFLRKAHFHNNIQVMYEDKQTVLDPLILLELKELKCGHVARVGVDLFDAAGYRTRLTQHPAHVSAEIFYDDKWHLFEANQLGGGGSWLSNSEIPSLEIFYNNLGLLDKIPQIMQIKPNNSEDEVPRLEKNSKYSKKQNGCIYNSYDFRPHSKEMAYIYKTSDDEQDINSKYYGWNYFEFKPYEGDIELLNKKIIKRYQPCPPKITKITINKGSTNGSQTVLINWEDSFDKDNDLLGYRVYLSSKTRGWNYQDDTLTEEMKNFINAKWLPEMHENVYKVPPFDLNIIQTKNSFLEIELDLKNSVYITVAPYDEYGESIGKTIYHMSHEIVIPANFHKDKN
jgi:hypothetical protein